MKKTTFILLLLINGVSLADRPTNEEPMYGGKHNPEVEENIERSTSAASLGWQYFYKGDIKTAIKRFNQAWMFNRNNPEAYWGFGLVMGQRAMQENTEQNLSESIKYLKMATQLSENNAKIIVDLAFSKTLLGAFLKDKKEKSFSRHFSEAGSLYSKAEDIEKNYPALYYNWSVLKFYEDKYEIAKSKLLKAKELGYEADPGYEKDLNEKLNNS